jgi:hypothetical protein
VTRATPTPDGRATHPALLAYRRRNRRLMRGYVGVLVVLMAVILGLVKIAYLRGEITHVSRSDAPAPAAIPAAATGSALTLRWQSTEHPASGTPYQDGIVVTYDAHTVNGRDALTGVVRWHYTRSDETVCSVFQQDASTIAFYDRHGNCDEVTGFATATGVPTFYRTVPDNGRPAIATASNVVMLVTPAAVHVFDNAGAIDRWTWTPASGCSVDQAVTGSKGVLISYHCGTSRQLTLHALTDDTQLWNAVVSGPVIPLTADAVIGAVNPADGIVTTYDATKGTVGRRFGLGAAAIPGLASLAAARASVTVTDSAQLEHDLIFAGGLLSISTPGTVTWRAAAANPATVDADGRVLVADGNRIESLVAVTGKPSATSILTPQPASSSTPSLAYRIGAGVLLANSTVAYYR